MSLFRTLKCFMSAFRISYSLLSREGSTKALRAVISHPTRLRLTLGGITARAPRDYGSSFSVAISTPMRFYSQRFYYH